MRLTFIKFILSKAVRLNAFLFVLKHLAYGDENKLKNLLAQYSRLEYSSKHLFRCLVHIKTIYLSTDQAALHIVLSSYAVQP